MLLQFKKEVSLENTEEELILKTASSKLAWKNPPSYLAGFFVKLSSEGVEDQLLGPKELEQESEEVKREFFYFIERLKQKGFFTYHLLFNGVPFASWIPLKDIYFALRPLAKEETLRLSRFCLARSDEKKWMLETPLFPGKIWLRHACASAIVHLLSQGTAQKEIEAKFPELPPALIEDFLILLFSAKMLARKIESEPPLLFWEFHDLFFHSRSRRGRHNYPIGGCYPFKGITSPPAVLKQQEDFERIDLFKPDIEELKEKDLPFTRVLEERKSVRQNKTRPLNARELGEFLYRAARIKKMEKLENIEVSRRPYPSGGARYELELYPIVHQCSGIEKGVYRYEPKAHQLVKYPAEIEKMDKLLFFAKESMGSEDIPKVLIVISARFERVFWKYRTMSYALILKNTGILMQNFYLVGTAMELSPCALGVGDSDLFAEVIGTDYAQETSVGEFALN